MKDSYVDVAKIQGLMREAAVKALKEGGELILDESNQIAPIDEGTLINSGNVRVDESDLTVIVSYDVPYAVRQHYDLELAHKNGRQALFLQKALDSNRARVIDHIAAALRRKL